MNIIFKTLEMKNFLSYGNNKTVLSLDFNKPILVVGRNYDSIVDGQVDSNGSGKTTLLNGISVSLYDRTIPSIEKDDLVNYINGKNMEVSLVFSVNNVNYKIVRYRKNKALGGNGVKLYVNTKDFNFTEEHDKTPDSISNTNQEIENIIGFPFEVFSRIVVFSATYEPFLSLPSSHASKANQRDIVEELFGLTELTRKSETLKTLISETKKELSKLQDKNEVVENERNRIITQINLTTTKKETWKQNKDEKIKAIKNELIPLSGVDIDSLTAMVTDIDSLNEAVMVSDTQLKSIKSQLATVNTENSRFNMWESEQDTKVANLVSKIEAYADTDFDTLIEVKNEIESLNKDILNNNKIIEGFSNSNNKILSDIDNIGLEIVTLKSNVCPYCKQEMLEVEAKIKECEASITALEVELLKLESEKEEVIKTNKSLTETLNKLSKIKIPDNIKQLQQDFNSWVTSLDLLKKQTNPYNLSSTTELEDAVRTSEQQHQLLVNELSDKKRELELVTPEFMGSVTIVSLSKLSDKIDNLVEQVENLLNEVNPFLSVEVELHDMLKSVPPPNTEKVDKLAVELEHQEFLLKLLTKKDSFIRKALLNKNIPYLNTRLDTYLKMMGLPHSVLFTEDMGVKITQFNTAYRYNNMSNGQKARVNLALSFAFRDVLQTRYSRINLCVLDECLDVGLGNVGVQLAAKMIKAIAKNDNISMFIISHKDEISTMFNDKLEIELREGFSNILESKISKSEEE